MNMDHKTLDREASRNHVLDGLQQHGNSEAMLSGPEPSTSGHKVPSEPPSNALPKAGTASSESSITSTQRPSTLRILMFGNSLMAGFSNFGTVFYPPAVQLKATLQASLPQTKITIDTDGLPGDLVCPMGRYLPRILGRCPPSPSPRLYDIIVMLGGTNDLCYAYTPPQIFSSLIQAWEVALETGAEVVALTVPELSGVRRGDRR